jgi:hypothetical protein
LARNRTAGPGTIGGNPPAKLAAEVPAATLQALYHGSRSRSSFQSAFQAAPAAFESPILPKDSPAPMPREPSLPRALRINRNRNVREYPFSISPQNSVFTLPLHVGRL